MIYQTVDEQHFSISIVNTVDYDQVQTLLEDLVYY